eukprot:gnl/TRDRNA2_/TRDRNA2_42111_c0_seq1.p1 gnl/TRDRNA2_/TRDRNA2_42111_c0~~gnl/TRDRNA2_/TRDRNA2_42111_c0_seq1.p1  ORF type:complete len:333 (+),score=12.84 gnl/TRDRNA2_/TRDRNA2_42111_c0_seq1:74-1072(+)
MPRRMSSGMHTLLLFCVAHYCYLVSSLTQYTAKENCVSKLSVVADDEGAEEENNERHKHEAGPVASAVHVQTLVQGRPDVNSNSYPHSSRIAIVLRGQAFRSGRRESPGCIDTPDSIARQHNQTQSLLDNIILPLERSKNDVDLYIAESSQCPLTSKIVALLEGRVKRHTTTHSDNQAHGMRLALDFFKLQRKDVKYDLIMVTRLDIQWKEPIDKWPSANFGTFNLFSHCPSGIIAKMVHCGGQSCTDPHRCVNDILHIMPAKHFDAFDAIVGTPSCFNPKHYLNTSGHFCYNSFAAAFGEQNISYVTPWIPVNSVREDSSIASLGQPLKGL